MARLATPPTKVQLRGCFNADYCQSKRSSGKYWKCKALLTSVSCLYYNHLASQVLSLRHYKEELDMSFLTCICVLPML